MAGNFILKALFTGTTFAVATVALAIGDPVGDAAVSSSFPPNSGGHNGLYWYLHNVTVQFATHSLVIQSNQTSDMPVSILSTHDASTAVSSVITH